jgi:anti-anti-sigma factor
VIPTSFDFRSAKPGTLEEGVLAVLNDGGTAIVDLDGMEALDAPDVRILISLLRRAREQGGDVALRATKPGVIRSLRVTALDRLFTVETEAA